MRLVDADALKEAMYQNGGCGICSMYVDDATTIDAIPVEWLEAQIRPYTGDVSDIGKTATNGTIKRIIRKWQKEQEVQDG